MKKQPPKKKAGQAKRIDNGDMLDIATVAQWGGWTEKALRRRIERNRIPFRRDGKRIIFFRDELTEFLRGLPGVTVEEATANEKAARGIPFATS